MFNKGQGPLKLTRGGNTFNTTLATRMAESLLRPPKKFNRSYRCIYRMESLDRIFQRLYVEIRAGTRKDNDLQALMKAIQCPGKTQSLTGNLHDAKQREKYSDKITSHHMYDKLYYEQNLCNTFTVLWCTFIEIHYSYFLSAGTRVRVLFYHHSIYKFHVVLYIYPHCSLS